VTRRAKPDYDHYGRAPSRDAPNLAPGELDLFHTGPSPIPQPAHVIRRASEGRTTKERELSAHEAERADVLAAIRRDLVALYRERARVGDPSSAFVNGDDAARIFDALYPEWTQGRAFLGSVFKSREWIHTGAFVESTQTKNHGRLLYCWKLRP
jgi:hypothetical protein